MKLPRLILAVLLCATTFLTGCIWLRMLALKKQLADFDRYVRVDDRDGLAFDFVKPVLYAKDVRALFELDPTSKTSLQTREVWAWTFEKVPGANPEPMAYDLTFTTTFERNKLTRLAIPERFLAFVPKPLIIGMVRAFGHAKVDQKKRSATAQWRSDERSADTNQLSQAQLSQMLGLPLSVQDTEDNYIQFYEYRLKSASLQKGKAMVARAECVFARATDRLARVRIRYGDLRMEMSFAP